MTLPLFDAPALMQGKPPKSLRPYQARAVRDVRALVLMGKKRILCVAPTGAGKMLILSNIIKSATLPVLFVAHRKELIEQCVQQLAGQSVTHVGVIRGSDTRYDPSASVQVGSIATLARRDKPFAGQNIIIIIDECFPAGTMVDGKPIESFTPGDSVSSFVPETNARVVRRVVRTFKRVPSSLVRLHCGERILICTPSHKVWTRGGWREASRALGKEVMLEAADEVDLRPLQKGERKEETVSAGGTPLRVVSPGEAREPREESTATVRGLREVDPLQRQGLDETACTGGTRILLGGAQEAISERPVRENVGRVQPQARIEKDARTQPNARSEIAREDDAYPARDGVPSTLDRRQGSWSDGSSTYDAGIARSGVARGVTDRDTWDLGSTEVYLRRSSERAGQDRDRDRRQLARSAENEKSRRAQRVVPAWTRVDRVEVLEPGRDGTFGGMCPDGHVYNLEVEDTHTYFANGVAVSNCHRAASDSYVELLTHYPDAIVIGFTATPVRLDGRPLGGDLFEELVQVATYNELLKHPDWLVAPDVFSGSEKVDVSGVRRAGSDFDESQLGDVMRDARLEGDVVRTWLARAHLHPVFNEKGDRVPRRWVEGERRRTVLFAVDVEHSTSLARRFEQAGVRVAHVDGTTPEHLRDAAFRDLAAGHIEVVCNCLVAVEGIDIPSIKCVSHARPTQSVTLWRQCTGRLMRPWNGVTPLLLDHAGNFDRLGCPFEDVVWSLKERHKRAKGQEPMRKCPSCGGYVPLSKTVCPLCGADLPRAEPTALAETDEELRQRQTEPEAMKWAFFWQQVVKAKSKGFKPGFASAIYKERYGSWPPRHWSEKIKADFASDGLWQSLLERRLSRKAEREAREAREEQAMGEARAADERSAGVVSPEQAEMERTLESSLESFDSTMDDRPIDDAPPDGSQPYEDSGFSDWLEDEGIL